MNGQNSPAIMHEDNPNAINEALMRFLQRATFAKR